MRRLKWYNAGDYSTKFQNYTMQNRDKSNHQKLLTAPDAILMCAEAIKFKSLSGFEQEVVQYFKREMELLGWSPVYLPVTGDRANLYVEFGSPKILFTTHLDVVAAPPELFSPRVIQDSLYGRGACDAKGIAATMMVVAQQLLCQGQSGFGILFVVGEEHDGAGAQAAARQLPNRGIQFIINGEPTEGVVASSHKGGLGFTVAVSGTACHSGYPEAGVDANRLAIELGHRLLNLNLGEDSKLGKATINLGRIDGGMGASVISPRATIEGLVRTVGPNAAVVNRIKEVVSPFILEITYDVPCSDLLEIPSLPSSVVAFCCDIPFFSTLGAQAVLYGPGSILRAHTDNEYITRNEIESAIAGYHTIFQYLMKQ